jgi:hypothetical protein
MVSAVAMSGLSSIPAEGAPATSRLPTPDQLARLGVVLCLYRRQPGGELSGWSQSVRAEASAGVDSEGLRESLLFYDRDGQCCWRLYLLPDSDFLAWERLQETLPIQREVAPIASVGDRLLRRLTGRVRGGPWQASILRLHALPNGPGFSLSHDTVLAASLGAVSALSAAMARRIAQDESADAEALSDDCCCQRAARTARAAAAASGSEDIAYPLIRLHPHTLT